jgi:hypothetical protein
MAAPLEPIAIITVAAAALSLIIHWRLASQSGSGLFAYCLLIAAAIAAAATAASLAPACPVAQAVADTGILLAGALAFAASGWLLFAFGMAGDAGDP